MTHTDGFGYFIAMRMWSWRRALDTTQPPFFTGAFAQTEEATFEACQNEGASPADGKLPDMVPADPNGIVNPVYIRMASRGDSGWPEPWKTWHSSNVPRPQGLTVPVAVWQGVDDVSVPVSETRTYVAELRAAGTAVDLFEVAGAHHNDCAIGPATLEQAAGEQYIAWLRARFTP